MHKLWYKCHYCIWVDTITVAKPKNDEELFEQLESGQLLEETLAREALHADLDKLLLNYAFVEISNPDDTEFNPIPDLIEDPATGVPIHDHGSVMRASLAKHAHNQSGLDKHVKLCEALVDKAGEKGWQQLQMSEAMHPVMQVITAVAAKQQNIEILETKLTQEQQQTAEVVIERYATLKPGMGAGSQGDEQGD